MASYDFEYTYDSRGNRATKVDHLAGVTTTYTYDAANKLLTEDTSGAVTTYTYDKSGNCTKKETPGETTFYEWNEENKMTKASPPAGDVEFRYNADGQRFRKSTAAETKHFLYDYERLLQEYDDAGDPNHTYTATIDEYGDLISEYDETDTTYYQYDAQGSADALLDANETPTDRYRYLAFGQPDHYSGGNANPFTYIGRQGYFYDEEISLYYLGAGNALGGGRPYDPATGRFLTEDPIGYEAGDANLYRYAQGNPVNATDPSGQEGVIRVYLNTTGKPASFDIDAVNKVMNEILSKAGVRVVIIPTKEDSSYYSLGYHYDTISQYAAQGGWNVNVFTPCLVNWWYDVPNYFTRTTISYDHYVSFKEAPVGRFSGVAITATRHVSVIYPKTFHSKLSNVSGGDATIAYANVLIHEVIYFGLGAAWWDDPTAKKHTLPSGNASALAPLDLTDYDASWIADYMTNGPHPANIRW